MIIIAESIKDVNMLIDKAEYLLNKSIEYKQTYPSLSKVYYNVYEDIKGSISSFHKEIVDFIQAQSEKSEIDEKTLSIMKSIWGFEHKQYIDKMNYLKIKENNIE